MSMPLLCAWGQARASADTGRATPAGAHGMAAQVSVGQAHDAAADTAQRGLHKDSTSGSAPAAAAQPPKAQPQAPEFSLEIPGGVLFGKFEKENGPFLINGSIIVPSGEVLEFGPGCKIYMGGDYSTITVFGQLIVKGTAAAPVIFQSAKARPNPWDWDRIYCRSRNRCTFEHCIIKHSNYGIMAENGSVTLKNCSFEHNSLHGLVVRNSDVTIANSSFTGGHVCAVLCDGGGDIQADSLVITDNTTGIAVSDKGSVKVRGGLISRNTNGIVALKGSSVVIVAADITKNRVGIVAQSVLPRKLTEMDYGNGLDLKIAGSDEIEKMLRPPEAVKSVVLPKASSKVATRDDFSPGFSAVRAPREASSSLIGNVTTGMEVFVPHSLVDSLKQNHYPGEENPGSYMDNVQPEVQLFASGKRGDVNVDLMLDMYGNSWTGVRRNNTSLSLNYSNQQLILGDFYENNSETSISNRKMTGLKYDGNFWEMGRGVKRINIRAAFGQSELPKEYGGHEIDLYNTPVDTGMSIRQQMTYEAALTVKPTLNSQVTARGLIARDQGYQTFIGQQEVNDPKAPNLLQAQTGSLEGKVDLLEGKLSLNAELDMGSSDTLVDSLSADSGKISRIAWYDPQVPDAVSSVLGVMTTNRNYSFTAGATGLFDGYKVNLYGGQIAPAYFSAGNPYLEIDRRILALTAEKDFTEKLSANLSADYQRRTLSTKPVDNTTIQLGGKYGLGQFLPEFDLDYMFYYETSREIQNVNVVDTAAITADSDVVTSRSVDSGYTIRDFKDLVGIEAKQQFANDMDYSLKYQLLLETDATRYVTRSYMNRRSGIQHQASARYGFRIGKILRNRITVRVTTKNEVLDSLNGVSYKIGDELKLALIPRKLNLNLKGEYSDKLDKKAIDTTSVELSAPAQHQSLLTRFYSFEAEVKYSLTSKWSLTARGRYESALDQTPGSRENYTVKVGSLYITYLF